MDDITLMPCSNNAIVVPTGAFAFISPDCKSVMAANLLPSCVIEPSSANKVCDGSLKGSGTIDFLISSPYPSTSLNSPKPTGCSPSTLIPLALKPPGKLENCPASTRERRIVVTDFCKLPRRCTYPIP